MRCVCISSYKGAYNFASIWTLPVRLGGDNRMIEFGNMLCYALLALGSWDYSFCVAIAVCIFNFNKRSKL